ncbi:hypothetical protein ACFWNK_19890 [Streptomyces sp. NPDC058417]|uniref:hypothetical protein n=1 Tax=unclassified Streptomyces TaxID=2593676 RepID=UPI0036686FA4
MTTYRTRYHVGMNEIGLDSECRVECLGDLDGARAWLEVDIANTAEDAEDRSEFDVCLARLATIPDAEIVGEHRIDAYLFRVRAVENCGCPRGCVTTGRTPSKGERTTGSGTAASSPRRCPARTRPTRTSLMCRTSPPPASRSGRWRSG